jgi:hypothetical protein
MRDPPTLGVERTYLKHPAATDARASWRWRAESEVCTTRSSLTTQRAWDPADTLTHNPAAQTGAWAVTRTSHIPYIEGSGALRGSQQRVADTARHETQSELEQLQQRLGGGGGGPGVRGMR